MRKTYKQLRQSQAGFTLIELLLVIAIIAILAAVIFVALDPLKRFADSRDSTRWSEVEEILHAIKIDQIDNRGEYLQAVQDMVDDEWYMIGTATTGCATATQDTVCDQTIGSTTYCVDLDGGTDGLVDEGYIASIPISPNNPNENDWTASYTGYAIKKTSIPGESGAYIEVAACEGENDTIEVQR